MATETDTITASAGGVSADVLFIPTAGVHRLACFCSNWSGSSAALQSSIDGTNWEDFQYNYGDGRADVVFSENDAYEVPGTYYYRINVTSYANPITLKHVLISHAL